MRPPWCSFSDRKLTVPGVYEDQLGSVFHSRVILLPGKAGDDYKVARMGVPRGGAVDANAARAGFGRHSIGLQAAAVADVPDMNRLKGRNVRGLEQRLVHCDTALIVQIRLGDRSTVDLRL